MKTISVSTHRKGPVVIVKSAHKVSPAKPKSNVYKKRILALEARLQALQNSKPNFEQKLQKKLSLLEEKLAALSTRKTDSRQWKNLEEKLLGLSSKQDLQEKKVSRLLSKYNDQESRMAKIQNLEKKREKRQNSSQHLARWKNLENKVSQLFSKCEKLKNRKPSELKKMERKISELSARYAFQQAQFAQNKKLSARIAWIEKRLKANHQKDFEKKIEKILKQNLVLAEVKKSKNM